MIKCKIRQTAMLTNIVQHAVLNIFAYVFASFVKHWRTRLLVSVIGSEILIRRAILFWVIAKVDGQYLLLFVGSVPQNILHELGTDSPVR